MAKPSKKRRWGLNPSIVTKSILSVARFPSTSAIHLFPCRISEVCRRFRDYGSEPCVDEAGRKTKIGKSRRVDRRPKRSGIR